MLATGLQLLGAAMVAALLVLRSSAKRRDRRDRERRDDGPLGPAS